MDIQVHAENFTLHPGVEENVLKKVTRLSRYLPNIANIYVEFHRQAIRTGDNLINAQITVRHARGAILRAEEQVQSDNPEIALNKALDNMYRRIERFKSKQTRKGKTRFSMSLEELDVAEPIPDVEMTDSTTSTPHDVAPVEEIIRRKTVDLVAMNEEEAVEQLELLGHTFFMFFNESTMSINVLYKRKEGGYGILVPNMA
jgi:putative sigma-54 modulation protein